MMRWLQAFRMIRVVRIRPTDVIVVETPEQLDAATADRMRAVLQQNWPMQRIVICDGGTTLHVVRSSAIDGQV